MTRDRTGNRTMFITNKSLGRSVAGLLLLGVFLGGCNSGGTSTDGDDFAGSEFVSTDATTGSVSLRVTNPRIGVGDTSGFGVTVRDANGAGVPNIRIACDSERGVAILEPTAGTGLTDSTGFFSGVLGCEVSGSFQFGCRVAVGGNRRDFQTVSCEGSTPPDFVGFPGGSGSGFGGGVVDNGDPDNDLRVTEIGFSDDGSGATSFSIDTTFSACPNPEDVEGFFDTTVVATVINDTDELIRLTSLSYTVENFDGLGTNFNLPGRIRFPSEVTASANGGSATIQALVFDAEPRLGATDKRFADNQTFIEASGIRNIRVTFFGVTASGESVSTSVSTALSFDDFQRC